MNSYSPKLDVVMNWYNYLCSEDVASTYFKLYEAAQITALFAALSADPLLKKSICAIGESEPLTGDRKILLGVDLNRPEMLLIALNSFEECIRFHMPPTFDTLKTIASVLLEPGRRIPAKPTAAAVATIQLESEVLRLKNSEKKETIVFWGLGDWDDMTQFEDELFANIYAADYPLAKATADGRDGAASQYYTAFSASLCSLIRTRALEKTLFYLHVEYVPASEDIMHGLKHAHPNDFFLKTLPNDIPADVAGLLLLSDGNQATLPQLIEEVTSDNFNSLSILCILSQICGKFDDIFMLLASHPNPRFRDVIAREAFYKRSHKVFAEVQKHGVSPEVLQQLTSNVR